MAVRSEIVPDRPPNACFGKARGDRESERDSQTAIVAHET
jgi:hypothetical protein